MGVNSPLQAALLAGTLAASAAVLSLTAIGPVRLLTGILVLRPLLDLIHVGDGAVSPGAGVEVAVLAVGLLRLLPHKKTAAVTPLSRTSKAALVMALAAVPGAVLGDRPLLSLSLCLNLSAGLVMIPLLERLFTEEPQALTRLLQAASGGLVLTLIVVAWNVVSQISLLRAGVLRVSGPFVHPNVLAEYLVTLLLILWAAPRDSLRLGKRGRPVLLGLGCAGLVLTGTRGSWMALMVALCLVAITRRSMGMLLATLVIPAAIIVLPFGAARLDDLGHQRESGMGDPNSLAFRFRYWHHILPLAGEKPSFGLGLGTTQMRYGLPPHNTPLQLLIETGCLGVMAASIGAVAVFQDICVPRERPPWRLAAVASVVAFAIEGAADNMLLQPLQYWYLAVPLAAALAPGAPASTAVVARAKG